MKCMKNGFWRVQICSIKKEGFRTFHRTKIYPPSSGCNFCNEFQFQKLQNPSRIYHWKKYFIISAKFMKFSKFWWKTAKFNLIQMYCKTMKDQQILLKIWKNSNFNIFQEILIFQNMETKTANLVKIENIIKIQEQISK